MLIRQALPFVALALLHVAVLAQPTPQPANTDINITKDLTFAEYSDTTLQLDLYRPTPSAEALPVVIVIREGGWDHGEKESSAPLASALARHGLAAASIEYRGASAWRSWKAAAVPTARRAVSRRLLVFQHH